LPPLRMSALSAGPPDQTMTVIQMVHKPPANKVK
jgi:hypothetical protein